MRVPYTMSPPPDGEPTHQSQSTIDGAPPVTLRSSMGSGQRPGVSPGDPSPERVVL